MKSSLRLLVVLMGALLLLSSNVATAQPGVPIFEYEWIKGHPLRPIDTGTPSTQDAVLRVMMSGDMDDPTSPGLTVAGFNLMIEIDEGVVDTSTSPVAGGGEKFDEIIPTSPNDANAAVDPDTSQLVRAIDPDNNDTDLGGTNVLADCDYRVISGAYANPPHATAPTLGRDEKNVMLWDGSGFLVEEIAGAPAGKKWIIITGVSQRLVDKDPLGDIPAMFNALTNANPTQPLGPAGSSTGTAERAAFLDIKFKVLETTTVPDRLGFYDSIKLLPNPLATEILAAEDSLPNFNASVPTNPIEILTDSNSFAATDGASGSSAPQILDPYQAPQTNSESWEFYR